MLEKFNLLDNLSQEMLEEVESICERKTYKAGDYLIREGEETTDIFFLVSGQVDLYKIEPKTGKNMKFKEQSVGDSFGEMSFIDGSPRSCSVEAVSETEAYVLSKEKLLNNANYAQEIISTFNQNIAHQVNDRLRYLSDRYITNLQQQIQQLEERNYYGFLFMGTGVFVGITSLTYALFNDVFSSSQFDPTIASSILLIVVVLPPILLVSKFKIPFRELGVTRKHLKKSILDGIIFSIIGLLVIMGIAWYIDLISPDGQALQSVLKPLTSIKIDSITAWMYWPNSYLQEFAARGVSLTSIKKFLSDKRGIYSVLLSGFFFGICHVPFGLAAVGATFIGGVVLGAIYLRTGNLAGVTIMHYIFGYVLVS